jgi:hypothetical protein
MSRPKVRRRFLNVSLACITASTLAAMGQLSAVAAADRRATLAVGASTVSITPDKPAPLMGQMRLRVAQLVESPVTAAALALETHQGDQVVDQAIFVVCDLAVLRGGVIDAARARQGPCAGLRPPQAGRERDAYAFRSGDGEAQL